MKYSGNTRCWGHFKLVIFNDFHRNYIENNDALINIWFIQDDFDKPYKPDAIVSIDYQSLKEDAKEDVEIIGTGYDGFCSIVGDASCGCCK